MDTVVKVGDIVHSYLYDMVEIVKINKKTYIVKTRNFGSVFTIDKTYIEKPEMRV